MEAIKKLNEAVQESKRKIEAEAKEAFKAAFADFFAKRPDVLAFRWTQYAPYFNDGEPCTFSRHDIAVAMDSESARALLAKEREDDECFSPDDAEADGVFTNTWSGPPIDPEVKSFIKDLESVGDEVYEVLGEGLVNVTRDGVFVADYSHE